MSGYIDDTGCHQIPCQESPCCCEQATLGMESDQNGCSPCRSDTTELLLLGFSNRTGSTEAQQFARERALKSGVIARLVVAPAAALHARMHARNGQPLGPTSAARTTTLARFCSEPGKRQMRNTMANSCPGSRRMTKIRVGIHNW